MDTSKPNSLFLGALNIRPDIKFDTQENQEEIILLLRAHPATLLPSVVNSLVLFILLFVFNLIPLSILTYQQIIFINIFGVIFIISYAWFMFLQWFFNVGIITNQRIIDIDFRNILNKQVSEAKLGRIEDITTTSGGYLSSIFNYGDILVQTAGEQNNIEFYKIPNPAQVVKVINSLLP